MKTLRRIFKRSTKAALRCRDGFLLRLVRLVQLVRPITARLGALVPPPLPALSILCIWAAIPCLALGQLGAGVLVAWLGIFLDLMAGKLAWPTLDLRAFIGKGEHWSSLPALGLWYLALGWHCSGGNLLKGTSIDLATWVLIGAFVLDKALCAIFHQRHQQELREYRPVDAAFHLIAAQRNISLFQLSAGVLLDQVHLALVLISGWMICTLLFHAGRWLWVEVEEQLAQVS